jgi:Tfp pilus assembly protein PilX
MGKNKTRYSQDGQILLVVVLVMIVALTIGVSVAARSITTSRTTSEEESSERAFSAAEAGMERSLANNSNTSGSFSTNNSAYTTTLTQLVGQNILIANNTPILKDNAVDVWLATAPAYAPSWTGNITIYWGQTSDFCSAQESTNSMAALSMVLLTGPPANPQITHFNTDPCAQRAASNNFSPSANGGKVNGVAFAHSFTLVAKNGILLAVIPLYSPASMGIVGCDANNQNCNQLPTQGTVITSVGKSDTATREIVSIKSSGIIPTELFPYTFFSP